MLLASFSSRRAVTLPRGVSPVAHHGPEPHLDSHYGRFQYSLDNPGLEISEQKASGELNFMQYAKDKRLAASDPSRWCKDRCLATGYCEVVEDFYDLTTSEVIQFCKQCNDNECMIDDASLYSDAASVKAEELLKSGFKIERKASVQ